METKFKVGDKVVINKKIPKNIDGFALNLEYEVTKERNCNGYVKIKTDGFDEFPIKEDWLAKVEEEKESVAGGENGYEEFKKAMGSLYNPDKPGLLERMNLDRLRVVMEYEDWADDIVNGNFLDVRDEEYKIEGMNGVIVGVRRAFDRRYRHSPKYERIRVRVSIDKHRVVDMAFTADEAEQLALVLTQKVREAREDRTMEINK